MSKKFIRYFVCFFMLVFIVSGCSKPVSNKVSEPANSNSLTQESGQSTDSLDKTTEDNNEQIDNNTSSENEDKTAETKTDTGKSDINASEPQETGKDSSSTDKKNNTDKSSDAKDTDDKSSSNDTQNKNSDDKNTTTTDSEVKNNKKVIVIDPGHGGKSGSEKEKVSPDSNVMKPKNVSGAAGIITKTPEHVITLEVSKKLKALLEKQGYTVIMTRTTASQTIGNIERAEIGNKNNADLVIRIHADSSTNNSVKGASMLVPGEVGYAKSIFKISRQYGEAIFKTLLGDVGMKSRGIVVRKDLTGFNWSKVPVVLIEMGFLSNPEEDKLLTSDDYQNKIAAGLCDGIKKALGD